MNQFAYPGPPDLMKKVFGVPIPCKIDDEGLSQDSIYTQESPDTAVFTVVATEIHVCPTKQWRQSCN